ncbi:Similar to Spef2: Sperm flagellar protein 2 (Mus musculus) [Cotesia congregata]|uniref:Similar to Spef2: Sperm flagellar protein 2 (Mus musculus) n=1 Tax=Cotesia congregata TaxID=51543 RepID=A0A8J2HH52_COTCN|nr:Similar to Spef2: Sperm flagellar protein 2 (Mus musculus) [Cotesia congregata]
MGQSRCTLATTEGHVTACLNSIDHLQDKDLRDYIDINAPWNEFIPEIDQESKEFIELGSITLGYIVHKLLLKFPQEFLRPKLPEVKVRAILLGVSDPKHYSTLQDLLKHQKISVIRVEDAINYCLQCYKEEKKDEDSAEEFKLETHSESSIKSPEDSTLNGEGKSKNITKIDKKTQTSKVIPFDDMHPRLSDSAYIGEWTHRFIIQGEPVSDELIAKVIFEYLKSFDDIKGWVLINYPVTYRQLAFLELSLSGRPLTDVNKVFSFNEDDIEDYEFEPQIQFEDSGESDCRESKLLPHLVKSDAKYNSCLTVYVRMIEKPAEVEGNAEELLEVRAEDITRVDEFYRDQGIARVVYYDECDSKTLKKVVRLIIGDVRAPRKSSEEIFESEEFRNSSVKSLSVESSQSQECKVKPGELNWTWVDLPLKFEVAKELVSLWRNCESTYVNELKDILSLKRLNLTAIIPYKDFVYNRVAQSGKIGSDKQELVKKFKEAFNSVIEGGFDKVEKSELRGDVEEFQMELWEICDAKRLKADEKRKKIILDDWTSKQIIVLVNIYVRIIQIEINRFVDTLEFLRWYYLTMLQRTIEDNIFRKIILDKVSGNCGGEEKKCPKLPEINDAALQKEIQSLMLGVSDNLEEVIDDCLQAITPTIDYAQSIVEELSDSAVGDLKKERGSKSKRRCSTVRVKKKSEKLSDVSVKPKKVKLGSKKKNLFLEWKYALMYEINRVKMRVQILNSAVKADIEFLLVNIKRGFSLAGQSINERYKIEIDNVNDLVKLFEKAIEDEHLIEEEINLVNDCFVIPKDVKVEPLVSEEEIDDKFRIEQLCYLKDVFQSVEPRGIISKVSFVYILQDLVTCEESEAEEEEEELKEGEYVISSLPTAWLKLTPEEIKKVVDEVFEDDTVDWREFIVYALDVNLSQDAMLDALDAFKQKDSDKDQIISRKEFFSVHLWPFNLKIEHEEIEKEEIFEAEKFNNDTDDLNKSQDEKIGDKEIDLEENDEEEIGRLYLMKLFVCDMFSNDDSLNYMEILLAFCKDKEPIYGFGKALSVFLGQKICMDYDEGEKYVASIEKQHSQQVIKRYAKRVSEKCVDKLIDCVAENLDRVDGSLERNIENAELVVEDQENLRLLSRSDEEDLKLTKSNEEDLKLTKSDQEEMNFSESDEDLLLYYNENFYDEQCHDISVLTSLLPQTAIEDLEASTGVSLKENLRIVSKELRCKDTKISCKLVLAHRLLRHDMITRMLASTNRFTAKNLSSILRKIIKTK